MSNNWNQSPGNNQPPGQNPPPKAKTGGLLSNYKNNAGMPENPSSSGMPNNPPFSGAPNNLSSSGVPPTSAVPQRKHSSLLRDYSQHPNPPSQVPNPPSQMPYPPSQNGLPYAQQAPAGPQRPQGPQGPYSQHGLLQRSSQGPQGPFGPQGQQQPPMPGQPGNRFAQPWANTMNTVRQLTGKVAAAVGYQHQQQPPAPQMVRYRPPMPQNPPNMGGVNGRIPSDTGRRPIVSRLTLFRRQRRKKSGPRRVMKTALISILVVVLVTAFAGTAYGYSFYQQQLPLMHKYASQQISQNSRIYDRNGVLLYEAYDQSTGNQHGRRVAVRYQDIPQVMQDAMISIEDKTFWTNQGVDPLAILRAGASSNGGASTLTQQLIKNLSDNMAPTYTRKMQEAAMAVGLTQNYSKAKILEMYFNVAPFGANTYGVEVATEDLFGLQPDCSVGQSCVPGISKLEYDSKTRKNDPILGLARASLLAGIPNNPSLYDPTISDQSRQNLLNRQKLVLDAMLNQGRQLDGKPITRDMAQQAEALSAKMTFKPYLSGIKDPNAMHFVFDVMGQIEAALGNGDMQAGAYAFETGGYNVRTTIDVNLIDYTHNAIQRHLYQPELQKARGYYATLNVDNNVNNAAVVVLDSKNGEVLAMNGSADYNSKNPKVEGQFNAATHGRPPGSTFKPFDYATAFQMGWTPGIILQDTRTYFPNGAAAGTTVYPTNDATHNQMNENEGVYTPSDYGQKYWEKAFTIRFATANSFNIAAIRAMQYTGQQAVLDMTRRMGITGLKAQGLSMAIGSQNVSPLQMASAYQTFADGGLHVPPQEILDIWDNYGHSLYHYDENNPPATRVFSPQVSYMMTSVLIDEPSRSFEFSGDHDLSFSDMDVACETNPQCGHQLAAKTGTTDSFADNWTIGYTPDVTVAVWAGNNDDSAMNDVIGITGAAPIFHSVIERVLDHCNYSIPYYDDASYSDGVPCGPDYKFRFSQGHEQWTFPIPDGVAQSYPIGMPPNSAQVDWMLQQ